MAAVTEEPSDVIRKTGSVYQDEIAAIKAQISTNLDLEEIGQEVETEVQHVLQNKNESIQQSKENNEDKTFFNKDEIYLDASVLCEPESDTIEENFENGNSMASVHMDVENCISEEVQVEDESICVVEDSFLKIANICGNVCDKDNYLVSFNGNESNLPENNDGSSVCKMQTDAITMTEEENVDFKWEKLFTPSQTNFIYPEDEKEVEKLAATLWEMRNQLLGRDLHDIITMCNFASQWKSLSEESKNYVFQRMSLLYLAVTQGWRYALATSNPHNKNPQKRPAVENFRGSYRRFKKRRPFYNSRPRAIPNQQTEQVSSVEAVAIVETTDH